MKPIAKINLGLNVVNRRPDGYHDLETVFFPVQLTDELSIEMMDKNDPHPYPCKLTVEGDDIACEEQKNLVVKAYNLLASEHTLPRIHVTLNKRIPSQAGMGGGSSDAAYMIRLLNEEFHLGLTIKQMKNYAAKLGADCAFFIESVPAYAEGIGERLFPIPGLSKQLEGYCLAIVKPDIAISTKEAFAHITPRRPQYNCLDTVMLPVEAWKERLVNDFEESVFQDHIQLQEIKNTLYRMDAVYAAMSGSGSAMFGIFRKITRLQLSKTFPECFTAVIHM